MIPDAAIEAAGDEVWSMTGGSPDSRAIAEQAIEAAMPAIREAIAQEIEAEYDNRRATGDKHDGGYRAGFLDGLDNAERIVRGGAE
jgi:hypothetical protein